VSRYRREREEKGRALCPSLCSSALCFLLVLSGARGCAWLFGREGARVCVHAKRSNAVVRVCDVGSVPREVCNVQESFRGWWSPKGKNEAALLHLPRARSSSAPLTHIPPRTSTRTQPTLTFILAHRYARVQAPRRLRFDPSKTLVFNSCCSSCRRERARACLPHARAGPPFLSPATTTTTTTPTPTPPTHQHHQHQQP
jgi:hypothetical protein